VTETGYVTETGRRYGPEEIRRRRRPVSFKRCKVGKDVTAVNVHIGSAAIPVPISDLRNRQA
jgi:hypothetical protein